jgi:hypothetical protein
MNLNRFVFAVKIAKVAAAPRLSSGVECRYVQWRARNFAHIGHRLNFIKMRYLLAADSLGETSVMITYIMRIIIDYNDNKA